MDTEWLIRRQIDPEEKRQTLDRTARTLRNLRDALRQFSGQRAYARRIRGEIEFWKLFTQDMEEGYPLIKPSLMFAERHTLDLGDLQLELVFFGKGHSRSDMLVYIPQEKLLVTGAIVYQRGHLPEIGEASTLEDVNRFMTVLDEFMAPEAQIDHIVSSHSWPLVKSDLGPVRDYYQRMLTGGRAALQEGLTLEQVTERLALRTAFRRLREPPPGDWAHGMHERNIRNLWRILQEEQAAVEAVDAGQGKPH